MWAFSQKQKKKQLTTCHSKEYNGGSILYIEDIKLSDMKILAPLIISYFFEVCSLNKASQTRWPCQ
jgi:hypothetical protein